MFGTEIVSKSNLATKGIFFISSKVLSFLIKTFSPESLVNLLKFKLIGKA